ncbi:hypothetical protein K493DRAFT_254511 [Basidiobolus meristosporus CBS 931.73]|uniref:SGNH hydrolase-type esterase domain-containing protein n=1 Tax=Basidiobolus meristosporus CBS 931.73 TaxID=1314790 RepID=A0A1Y1YY14_9FUNG|nr:hypothetical protein K493DRAFT_254511 [Basidiobolus meristosporus CBS 931.73]|eukprot:ORY02869.1 hypothetical protein K493DRAFT_254511 [Basidiobolus meristosporus CBS 931.73]
MIRSPGSRYHSPNTRILLITPPPLDEPAWEKTCLSKGKTLDRNAETTYSYAIGCVEVAEELNIPVVNLWRLVDDSIVEEERELCEFLVDGLHLSALGNAVLAKGILAKINAVWPEIYPENMEMILPWWGDVDPSDPAKSLIFPDH